jgi:hypothetical protein
MASFDEFINSIIADGNDGKAFELFCKHFLETAPEYKDQFGKSLAKGSVAKQVVASQGHRLNCEILGSRHLLCARYSRDGSCI